ncbi:4-phosphoerythronate dehydrogenase [Coxiella burnetii]|uniref:4-phosphoerythronate dehydrogenase n=1 Tax=Coxiella burnetii TaxID=777 RepID=UPI0009B8D018|nr:4-phosphoerythronate dehydrogenase [Coxiella burnetii]
MDFQLQFSIMIKILADDRIPFVSELFGDFGELILKPGAHIQNRDLLAVNALLTRSITSVDSALLEGTAVEFVGSATAGFDHIDSTWLKKQSIHWAYAPGANATAVAEYVLHCVAYLHKKNLLPRKSATAAIIGVGHVGCVVSDRLRKIGFTVFHNDPPRAQLEKDFISVPLASLANVDLVCLHTPLVKTGNFPTYHLIDNRFLKMLKPGSVLLNAGRGAVIDNNALLQCDHVITCLDVWENEPTVNLQLLEKTTIATSHIAGYSKQAKLRATLMIYDAFLKYFHLSDTRRFSELQQLQETMTLNIQDGRNAEDILLTLFDPGRESQRMREALAENPDQFEYLRRHFPLRNEFSAIQLTPTPSALLRKELDDWGFK